MPIRAGSTSGWASSTSRAAGQVPEVLGQWIPAPHHLVDQIGVAAVVVGRVPVGALSEAAQVGRQHHDGPAGPTRRRSRCPGASSGSRPHTSDLPGPWPWTARTAEPGVHPIVGDQQIGGDRHGVLGVEHDPLPPVAAARRLLGDLDVQGDPLGPRREERPQPGREPVTPRARSPPGRRRQRVGLFGRHQAAHHLEPGREVARLGGWIVTVGLVIGQAGVTGWASRCPVGSAPWPGARQRTRGAEPSARSAAVRVEPTPAVGHTGPMPRTP